MAWYPGAVKRPINKNYTARVTTKNCVVLHTSASRTARSLHAWFQRGGANASSHFHVDDYGIVEQYVDTKYMSWANGEGNPRAVTIETQGDGTGVWTSACVKSLIALVRWACDTHGIPTRQMASSAASQHGIGWHRLGVNGNFPEEGIERGRLQRGGGQVWSSARGKVCPGTKRIHQIPGIVEAVNTGNVHPSTGAKPTNPAPRPVAKQSTKNRPNKSTTFPTDYENLAITKKLDELTKGALQILMHQMGYKRNKQWDADFGSRTVGDVMAFLRKAGYYKVTPFAAKGARKSVALKNDGKAGYWFWVEFQRFLKDRKYYKGILDGDPGSMTYEAIQKWLNNNNGN